MTSVFCRAEEKPAGTHWAFVPPLKEADFTTIDAYLAAEHGKRRLVSQPSAERAIWVRRVYLDLIGVPPSLEEMEVFQKDSHSSRARIIDRLLADPRHGERWGRHLMDIWRYSDWYGLGEQLRYSQKHIWHWRDWIVESLNEDRAYDEMIREMLAGDEIAPDEPAVLRATGFLARNYYLFNRTTWLDDVIEHTGKAFLGITMNCVKCHEHKFDPFTHADYYAFRAIFEPHHVRLDAVPGQPDLEKDGLPRVYDLHLERATFLHEKGDEKQPDESKAIAPGVPAVLGGGALEVHPIKLTEKAAQSMRAEARIAEGKGKDTKERVVHSLKALDGPDEKEATRFLPFPQTSTGRRLALANWITDKRNPLTARVIVNHVWLRHFGQPLVANVFDFGKQSVAPPMQALLDSLAVDFMQSGWSLKWLHRQMVLSDAYAMTSSNARAASVNRERDPDNKYLWRMNPVRMDSHTIRDSLLQLAGRLDATMGGPTIASASADKVFRRSLYFNTTRDDVNAFLSTFDNPNVLDCYRRAESIVPQQALALMNAQTSMSAAGVIAIKLGGGRDEEFVSKAFRLLLAMEPSAEEARVCIESLRQSGTGKDAREALVHTLLNHNDFITIR